MNNILKKIKISGSEVWPIIEGGKGVGVTNGITAGHFAAAGAVGTFSGANPAYINEHGESESIIYRATNRIDRHEELVAYSIKGGISQAQRASDIDSTKNGKIHMNILWEMGGATRILEGILEGAKNLLHGVTAGAGMPYKLGELCSKYKVHYYPIISSARAFGVLWKRAFSNFSEYLGGVVYEDPWLAGGHNGLSNSDLPNNPMPPRSRLVALREFMKTVGLDHVPIIMAGGVWHINDWKDFIDDPEIAPIAFQFGTRPLLTKESPISQNWKNKLMTLKEGDVMLNNFSPTGFYSSAVKNNFIKNLAERSERQIPFSRSLTEECDYKFNYKIGEIERAIFINLKDKEKVEKWMEQGFTEFLRTPSETIIFVTPTEKLQITEDQTNCMGCLSHCKFSNWKDHDDFKTGIAADPRSYCIQKTLQAAISTDDIENQLMFSGHNAFKFAQDPFYANGFVPTIQELVDRILIGA